MESWPLWGSGIAINAAWALISEFIFLLISKNNTVRLADSSEKVLSIYAGLRGAVVSCFILSVIIYTLFWFDNIDAMSAFFVMLVAGFILLVRIVYALFVSSRYVTAMNDIGLSGADSEVAKGLGYAESLKLCNRGLKFLGVGAHKLVTSDEFAKAVKRCEINGGGGGVAARFLLCHPDSKALNAMEGRNKVASGKYSQRIVESLRVLAELVEQDYRIEVRLYNKEDLNDIPVFRLMMINESMCLLSFHVVDEANDEGRRLPQMHISSRHRVNGMPSFYKAYDTYFENLWKTSEAVEDLNALLPVRKGQ